MSFQTRSKMSQPNNIVADFKDAFRRHRDDGDILFEQERWANSDHLYGLAAECGLKAVMLGCGMSVDNNNTPTDKNHKQHINNLWDEYIRFMQSNCIYILSGTNIFKDWHVNQRYSAQSNFTKSIASNHKTGVDIIESIVNVAESDGVV